jgi:hypothetical protein
MSIFKSAVKSVLLLGIGAAFLSPIANAGTRDGGGGIGVRCVSKQKETFELLDLYEARGRGSVSLPEPKDARAATSLVSDLFARHFWNVDTIPVNQVKSQMHDLIFAPIFNGQPWYNFETQRQERVEYVNYLPLSGDVGAYRIPSNCVLVQIAYYDDKSTALKIVKPLWDKLSVVEQGGP